MGVKRKSRILLTGGFGYLGARLALDLEKHGYDVVILARESARHTGDAVVRFAKRFPIAIGDITKPETLTTAFAKLRKDTTVDAVIHLAAVNENVCAKNPKLAFEVNAWGTRNVIDAAATADVRRFVYFSTFHAYGEVTGTATESLAPIPLHVYGSSHFLGELFCREIAKKTGIELAILRPTNGIGAPAFPTVDRWSLLLLDLCRQAHETGGLRLASPGYQLRDFVSIDDLATATRLVLAAPSDALADPVFNVASGVAVRVRDVAKEVQVTYEDMYHKTLPLTLPPGKNDAPRFTVSIRKIGALGFTPTTNIEREIRETLRFCEVFRK